MNFPPSRFSVLKIERENSQCFLFSIKQWNLFCEQVFPVSRKPTPPKCNDANHCFAPSAYPTISSPSIPNLRPHIFITKDSVPKSSVLIRFRWVRCSQRHPPFCMAACWPLLLAASCSVPTFPPEAQLFFDHITPRPKHIYCGAFSCTSPCLEYVFNPIFWILRHWNLIHKENPHKLAFTKKTNVKLMEHRLPWRIPKPHSMSKSWSHLRTPIGLFQRGDRQQVIVISTHDLILLVTSTSIALMSTRNRPQGANAPPGLPPCCPPVFFFWRKRGRVHQGGGMVVWQGARLAACFLLF